MRRLEQTAQCGAGFWLQSLGQPLAAAGNEAAQFGVQVVGRRGRYPLREVIHVCNPFVRLSKGVALSRCPNPLSPLTVTSKLCVARVAAT